jgi:iron complex transport system substrate-binding protein
MRRFTRALFALVMLVASVSGAVSAAHAGADAPEAEAATAVEATDTQGTCEFPVSATDATGTNVTVSAEPERIVTLSPSAAQTMWEIGGKEKVVGVSQYASYLDGAGERTNVSASGNAFVDVETVVSLEPDLVLAPNVISNETVAKLREAGLTVYRFRAATSIEDIEEKTLLMGRLTGECEGAEETVAWMEDELSTVREAVEGEDRPRALYVFFGYTAGEGTFSDTVITTAGGRNVAAEANITGFRQISSEVVVSRNPQWIVVNDGATQVPQTDAYNSTTAVQEDQIVVVQEEHISQPAPRIVEAVVTVTKALHPDAYEQAVQSETTTETTAAETTATEPTTEPAETTATPGTADAGTKATGTEAPGFGVGVAAAALALVATGLLARRE